MPVITPTNGRIVWFTPPADFSGVQHDKTKPLAAMVVHVWGDRMVNLIVFDSNGDQYAQSSVVLVQEGDPINTNGRYAEWMPYQKGQAAKTETVEAALAAKGFGVFHDKPNPGDA